MKVKVPTCVTCGATRAETFTRPESWTNHGYLHTEVACRVCSTRMRWSILEAPSPVRVTSMVLNSDPGG